MKEPDRSRPNNGDLSATAQTVVIAPGGHAILQPGQAGTTIIGSR